MTSSRAILNPAKVVKNTLWNLSSVLIPIAFTIIATPLLVNKLGTERFGLITISWSIVGYLSVFDLGLGRTLTQAIASRLPKGDEEDIAVTFWTAMSMMMVLGTIGALVGAILTPTVLLNTLNVDPALEREALYTLLILSLSLPMVVTSSALRGTLEAVQEFRILSLMRTGLGIFSAVGPVVTALFTSNVAIVVLVVVLGRVINWVLHWIVCRKRLPELSRNRRIDRLRMPGLLKSGGWMSVSGIVIPLLTTVDRFVIASVISVAAAAWYTVPYDALISIGVIPSAIAGVMFPTFSTLGAGQRDRIGAWLRTAMIATLCVTLPITLFIVFFAHNILDIWLGAEFSEHSTRVLQILAIGALGTSMGQVPYALIQGLGKASVTARIHLAEIPLYGLALALCVTQWGITGAAFAAATRVILECITQVYFSFKVADIPVPKPRLAAVCGGLAIIGVVLSGMLPIELGVRLPLAVISFGALVLLVGWSFLSADERAQIRTIVKHARPALRARLHP